MANDLWRKTKELWREHERKKNLAELEWNLAPVGRYEEFFEKAIACYNHLIVRGKTEGLFYQMKLPKWSPRYQEWLETGPWYRGPWLSDLEKGLRQSEESLAKVRALHEGLCDPSNEGLNLREFLCRYRRYSPERGYYVEPQDNPGVDASIYWHFGKDTRNAIVPLSVFCKEVQKRDFSRKHQKSATPSEEYRRDTAAFYREVDEDLWALELSFQPQSRGGWGWSSREKNAALGALTGWAVNEYLNKR